MDQELNDFAAYVMEKSEVEGVLVVDKRGNPLVRDGSFDSEASGPLCALYETSKLLKGKGVPIINIEIEEQSTQVMVTSTESSSRDCVIGVHRIDPSEF